MKKFTPILLFLVLLINLGSLQPVEGQDLPYACIGTTEKYGVKGFNGISDFDWVITDPNGNVLPASSYQLFARGDSIAITWSEDMKGGIYTIDVTEHTDYGCTGSPYTTYVTLNTPEIFIPIDNNMADGTGVCYGKIAELDPGSGYISYLWQDGNTNQIYYTGEAGTYTVRLVNGSYSCSYDSTKLEIYDLPNVSLGNDTVLFGSQALELDVYNPDFNFYNWSTGAITPGITVDGQSGNQQVWVIVTDLHGCENSDTINIKASDYSNLRIPAAFTPNGDGINDAWKFPAPENGVDLTGYLNDVNVQVFNRWGKLVWKSHGAFKEWTGKDIGGKELPMDSYHYLIVFTVGDKKYEYKGSITIIR
ncbi:MAG: gliding motility-associated C-terminal domain-containing protein [Bacteroidales bacterium]